MTDPYHAQQHDLGDAVQLDTAETLAGPPNDDPLDSGWVPPDRPVAMDRTGVTAWEQRDGTPLDERLSEEEPDVGAADMEDADPENPDPGDADTEDPDTENPDTENPDPGDAGTEADPRAGRLVAPDEGVYQDQEPDALADDVGVDGGAASAEEAAMHIRSED